MVKKTAMMTKKKRKRARKRRKRKAMMRAGGAAGGIIASELGIPSGIGSSLGTLMGRGLAYITGHGDYKVSQNSLAGSSVPSFGNSSIRVKHKEYLGELSSLGSEFSIGDLSVNPGLEGTFPWLSKVAAGYQEYRFKGLVFEFKSNSATAIGSTDTSLGSVIIATRYNPESEAFTTKREMESTEFASSAAPCVSIMHAIECAASATPLEWMYIRTEATGVEGKDLRFSDHCAVSFATVGQQAPAVLGEIWVSYDVELQKPRLESPLFGSYAFGHWYKSTGDAGPGTGDRLLTDLTHNDNSSPFFVRTSTGITFEQPGRYLIRYYVEVTGGTITSFSGFTGFTANEIEEVDSDFNFQQAVTDVTSGTMRAKTLVIDVFHHHDSGHDNSLGQPVPTFTGSLLYAELSIIRVSGLYGKAPTVTLTDKLSSRLAKLERLLNPDEEESGYVDLRKLTLRSGRDSKRIHVEQR